MPSLKWDCEFAIGTFSTIHDETRVAKLSQAIRELELHKHKRDIEFVAAEALLYCHDTLTVDDLKDHEIISRLQDSIYILETKAPDQGLLFGAWFAFYVENYERSRHLLEILLSKNRSNVGAIVCRGWVELLSSAQKVSSEYKENSYGTQGKNTRTSSLI